MFTEMKRHIPAYSILFIGLFVFLLLFFLFWPDHSKQRTVIIGLGIFYFVWGISSHVKARHISPHVFFEYLSVSLLATFLLLMVTF